MVRSHSFTNGNGQQMFYFFRREKLKALLPVAIGYAETCRFSDRSCPMKSHEKLNLTHDI